MLRLNEVSKKFAQVCVLQKIQFQVNQGSIVGLAGASGSGKSTLLRCIQKLEAIDTGDIECTGATSFMFQDFQLFPHMTVLENLTYAPKLKGQQGIENEAMHLLAKLNIENKAHHYPAKLSGGQKQRVALARCLMMKPKILLCDEPTSGLDVATMMDVVQLLQGVQKMGVTMLIASHDLDFLVQVAQRIIVLKNGMNVADVQVANLLDPVNHLKTLYQEAA